MRPEPDWDLSTLQDMPVIRVGVDGQAHLGACAAGTQNQLPTIALAKNPPLRSGLARRVEPTFDGPVRGNQPGIGNLDRTISCETEGLTNFARQIAYRA